MHTARRNGTREFTAEIRVENKAMQAVPNKSKNEHRRRVGGNDTSYKINFE
jgi:hypothetical protein